MYDTSLFHKRVKEARKAANLSQTELGNRIGATVACVSGYEQNAFPTVERLTKIAEALNVSTDWLLGKDKPTKLTLGDFARIYNTALHSHVQDNAFKAFDVVSVVTAVKDMEESNPAWLTKSIFNTLLVNWDEVQINVEG